MRLTYRVCLFIKREIDDEVTINLDIIDDMIEKISKGNLKFEVAISSVKQNFDIDIAAFQWSGKQQREQKDRYLPHPRNIFKISKRHSLDLYDITDDKNFPGTTDAIMEDIYQAMAKLTTSDLKPKYTVLTVLINLVDDWQIFCSGICSSYGRFFDTMTEEEY
nr:2444_t:CDS:2 [Entrophospora candida]